MNLVSIDKKLLKSLNSKENNIKLKFNNIFKELHESPTGGEVYRSNMELINK